MRTYNQIDNDLAKLEKKVNSMSPQGGNKLYRHQINIQLNGQYAGTSITFSIITPISTYAEKVSDIHNLLPQGQPISYYSEKAYGLLVHNTYDINVVDSIGFLPTSINAIDIAYHKWSNGTYTGDSYRITDQSGIEYFSDERIDL